jgi:hypothetical protein
MVSELEVHCIDIDFGLTKITEGFTLLMITVLISVFHYKQGCDDSDERNNNLYQLNARQFVGNCGLAYFCVEHVAVML